VWHDCAAVAVALAPPIVTSAGTVALAAAVALDEAADELAAPCECECASSPVGMCAEAPTQPLGGKATSCA